MSKELEDVGVVVGRFQLDYPHEGHLKLLDTANKHSRLIIIVGLSHGKCTTNNPLDFQARRIMLQELYPEATIFYIKDIHDDKLWSQDLDERIMDVVGPNQTVMLYGSRDSFIDYYHGQFPTTEVEAEIKISATEIRKQLSLAVSNSRDWRAGACWAMANQWAKPIFTIDVAILNEDASAVLLGRKKRETMFRFIGGFVANNEQLEETVAREALEEAGVVLKNISYIASCPIDDWRYRGEKDSITTTFFKAYIAEGTPIAGDDIHEVKWFKLEDIQSFIDTNNDENFVLDTLNTGIVPNHRILMKHLLSI